MAGHTLLYTIADDEAVKVLLDKLLICGPHQQRRERLLKALDDLLHRDFDSASLSGSICLLGTNLVTKPFQIDQNRTKPERGQGSVSSSKSKSFKILRRFSKSG
jgi:hypothetical protein